VLGCSQSPRSDPSDALTADADVRANPAYRLQPLATLPDGYARSLAALGVDLSKVYGLLVADRRSGLTDKIVDQAGAGLFSALRRPGRMPPESAGRLLELVLDGVLEIETAEGFVSGPPAWEAMREGAEAPAPVDRMGRLAHAALGYAERLRLPVDRLTARLYCYHRVPLTRRWLQAYPERAVRDQLDRPALRRDWIAGDGPGWLSWTRRGVARPMPYKLYVSPAVEALPDVLPQLADALTAAGARHFTVGPDAAGLLRPDKIVVYMADAEELARVARSLEEALGGAPAHGVPFTAEVAGEGLLSWGGDPPHDAGPVGGGVESWRLSVARRLAESLHAAQVAPLRRLRPADFALARLALDGIDVRSFAPAGLVPPAR